MLVAKMAGKLFQVDLPGAPLRRFHSCAMIFFFKISWGPLEMILLLFPSKRYSNQVDTSRIKSLTTGKVDADSMSFGPPKAGAGGPSWGRGSQTKGPSRTEDSTKMQNRFAQLESSESSAPQGYDGRGSGGRFGRGGGLHLIFQMQMQYSLEDVNKTCQIKHDQVTLAGTLEAAQASRREAPTEEELEEQRPLNR